jgi:exodeoxyribonuclease VII large subunit
MRLEALESRSVLQRPMTLVDERRQLCDELADQMQRAIRLQHERLQRTVQATAGTLDALSPLKVLSRGYSLTTTSEGSVVRSVSDVSSGDAIRTRTSDGTIQSVVSEIVPLKDAD